MSLYLPSHQPPTTDEITSARNSVKTEQDQDEKLLQLIFMLHFYDGHLTFFGQTAVRNVSP